MPRTNGFNQTDSLFRLVLKLHAPLILPQTTPRLDSLLQEAMARRHQDWQTRHDLPLKFDSALGVYRASQMIFGMTAQQSIASSTIKFATQEHGLDRAKVKKPKRRIRKDGGIHVSKMTSHTGYYAPYVLFYAQGDPEAVERLLAMLSGIGREYANGFGYFTIAQTMLVHQGPGANQPWRFRPLPAGTTNDVPFDPIPGVAHLVPNGEHVDVVRPRRMLRETMPSE